jgi:hypothetical protein
LEPTNSLVIGALTHIETHSVNATDAIVLHAALGLAHHLRARGDELPWSPPTNDFSAPLKLKA